MDFRVPLHDKDGHIFADLPRNLRPSGMPEDAHLAFNILSREHARSYVELCHMAQQPPALPPAITPSRLFVFLARFIPALAPIAQPEPLESRQARAQQAHNNQLANLANSANFEHMARELARTWGVAADKQETSLRGLEMDRNWPDAESIIPSPLHIRLVRSRPDITFLFGAFLSRAEHVEIRNEKHELVFSTAYHNSYFRPGPWTGSLLTQYACLKQWRSLYEDDTRAAPKPAAPLGNQFRLSFGAGT